ncbi:oxygenase MpaB family protein [Streptomyces sp. NPDC057116]|uniref:oxygenase MpaB family protein n=1 Tax=Streptomyces sp. NPDC057116 TaxID=3346023 RepID=UPI00363153CA
MHGTDRRGRRYHGLQAELCLWVHTICFASLITLTDPDGMPRTPQEHDQLYDERKTTGRHLGLHGQHLPPATATAPSPLTTPRYCPPSSHTP